MAFDLQGRKLVIGDTLELVEKINAMIDDVEGAANGFLPAHSVVADEIDWSDGDWQEKILSADTAFTFAGVPTGFVNSITLLLEPGAYTPTFPGTVDWPLDYEPVWTNGLAYMITFTYVPSKTAYLAAWQEYDVS